MTAYASQQSAIDAVNLGAFQYLIKNAKNDEIKLIVRNAIEMRRVRSENLFLKRELRRGHDEKTIIGSSEEMVRVFKMVEKVARFATLKKHSALIDMCRSTGSRSDRKAPSRCPRWPRPLRWGGP